VRNAIAVVLALGAGLLLATYDLRTDDTGIEVGLLLIISFALAFIAPRWWWAIALLLGGFIPIFEMSVQGLAAAPAPSGAVALVFTFIGALGGSAIARVSRMSAAA
jgi:hypothetical protein